MNRTSRLEKRRVLIVSPHFPPINAADHQRIRMSLPYFADFGWEPTILTVDPTYVNGVYDPLLSQTVPEDITVVSTPALPQSLTQRLGLGDLGWRCLPYFAKAGTQLLRQEKFDLIYFSTTVFSILSLATYWHQKFHIPYVIDFQDPWFNNYYKQARIPPPGGRLKYGLSQLFARIQEPKVMRKVSHIVSVSPKYPKVLCDRYPWLTPQHCIELPFGAPQADFKKLASMPVQHSIFDPQDGLIHWVYVGVVGPIMALALRILFCGIEQERQKNPTLWQNIRLHFIGTSYAPAARALKTVEPIAQEFGLDDLVEEQTQRVPYFEALKILAESDAILLIGSDDPSYTASKLYPCILAEKPILSVFHQQSSVVQILDKCNAGRAITFNHDSTPRSLLPQTQDALKWLLSLPKNYRPSTHWNAFEPYTAREMTRKQCEIFDRCIGKTLPVQEVAR